MNQKKYYFINLTVIITVMMVFSACQKKLDTPPENKVFGTDINYADNDMLYPVIGVYQQLYSTGATWDGCALIGDRGDDVTPKGDQVPLIQSDLYSYDNTFWIYNAVWQEMYTVVLKAMTAIDQIKLYAENTSGTTNANQYIAEVKTIKDWELLQLSYLWGAILIPESANPADLVTVPTTSKDSVMDYISREMDEAIPYLPDMRPNQRTDVTGGVTKYTALAIKALAELELENYQKVADATSQIIGSGLFSLNPDFTSTFRRSGKLDNSKLLVFQYSTLGTSSGTQYRFPYQFFYPSSWSPLNVGAMGGWGFWEPTRKYIKFMLDRGEVTRLKETVLFTPDGVAEIESDPNYANLPTWITSNLTVSPASGAGWLTPDGDTIFNSPRLKFYSGKFILPSTDLPPGRKEQGADNNYTCIRYAQILLMYAEALTRGANGTVMTADQAVNLVRERAGLSDLTGVTADQVMNEKYAELATEWGIRFHDMVRLKKDNELSFEGRSYTDNLAFIPYPLNQVSLLQGLQ